MLRAYQKGAPLLLFLSTTACLARPSFKASLVFLPPLCTSRVVMIHALTALVLALPLSASALHSDSSFRRRHAGVAHKPAYMRRAANYTIKDHFVGEDFLCVAVRVSHAMELSLTRLQAMGLLQLPGPDRWSSAVPRC